MFGVIGFIKWEEFLEKLVSVWVVCIFVCGCCELRNVINVGIMFMFVSCFWRFKVLGVVNWMRVFRYVFWRDWFFEDKWCIKCGIMLNCCVNVMVRFWFFVGRWEIIFVVFNFLFLVIFFVFNMLMRNFKVLYCIFIVNYVFVLCFFDKEEISFSEFCFVLSFEFLKWGVRIEKMFFFNNIFLVILFVFLFLMRLKRFCSKCDCINVFVVGLVLFDISIIKVLR